MKQLISTTKKDSTLVVSWIEDNKHMIYRNFVITVSKTACQIAARSVVLLRQHYITGAWWIEIVLLRVAT
jgi:hypothetical protein